MCAKLFVEAIEKGGASPISPEEIFEVMRVCLKLKEKL